ncbi:MAG: DNA-binding protein Alba [Candidatus Bathyarchaeota archaeon]|nr:MAG: DNA-binding protein Alba [Candidatus Bathyarchaeota archaeon]
MDETLNDDLRDHVIVGLKPIMNYVVACMTLFNAGKTRIRIKARGRNISKAVDVVEMLRRVFMKDLVVEGIGIGTEVHHVPNGREASVSTIEIRISHP